MRFFWAACLVGIIVASLGCMTKNWSSSIFREDEPPQSNVEKYFPTWGRQQAGEPFSGSQGGSETK